MKSVKDLVANDVMNRMKCRARAIPLIRISGAENTIRNLEHILIQKNDELLTVVAQRDAAMGLLERIRVGDK